MLYQKYTNQYQYCSLPILQCKHCPTDYIGKITTPLQLRIVSHRTTVPHLNLKLLVSAHASENNN